MKKLLTLLSLLLAAQWTLAQGQVVRGTVLDENAKSPLIGASVVLLGSDPLIGSSTDADGAFKLTGVPAGRHSLKISYVGNKDRVLPNLLVTTGKELVLEVSLEESVEIAEEVVVSARKQQKPGVVNNEMATVSARAFDLEETGRYAGSRNDPARMAQNFAGVNGSNDSRNDIIIRGNSPVGLLWRLEGIDIPNPSHYGQIGATGGPLSMLNNNQLARSDFFTGAFPAEYGNATSGVFDLKLRKGNNEKREYMAQMGLNGFEAGAEGPFSKGSRGSYMVNYRYSVLSVFQKLGVNVGTGDAVPKYQDMSFKIDLPTTKAGRFTLFGLGGTSDIDMVASEKEDDTNAFGSDSRSSYWRNRMGVMGFTHLYFFNENTSGKLMVSASGMRNKGWEDSLSTVDRHPTRSYNNTSGSWNYRVSYVVNKKLSARNTVQMGATADQQNFALSEDYLSRSGPAILRNEDGSTYFYQGYGQWQHRFSDQLTLVTGLRYLHFALNNSQAVEPRVGMTYQFSPRQTLNFGAGIHNQLQMLPVYFTENRATGHLDNKNLDFTRSKQLVLGYNLAINENLRFKAETYYQQLDRVPVEQNPSSFSLLNAGADYTMPNQDSLVNQGKGRNYGLELTLERFYYNGYYFLTTASLYDSRYKGSDEKWRHTVFNGNVIANALAGKEWKVGQQNAISLDFKVTYAGGQRYTPIDLAASQAEGHAVYLNNERYSRQNPDYFRTDVKVSFRKNGRRITQEWFLDVQNITNRQNLFNKQYDRDSGTEKNFYQLGLFSNFQYRIQF